MADMKMMDRITRHEIAGYEIAEQESAGHKNATHKIAGQENAGHEIAGQKNSKRQFLAVIFNTQHYDALCVKDSIKKQQYNAAQYTQFVGDGTQRKNEQKNIKSQTKSQK